MTLFAERSSLPRMSVTEKAAEPSPRSRAFIWWGAALGALVLGYADLWRGGETIAPVLLVLGYLVLVPLAILKR